MGTDPVTAVLAADSNYASVTSNVQPETVSKVAGSDVLNTSNATPTFGQSVTLTDTIPVVNGVAPTGTVSFYNGATLLGTGVPNASGVATLATTALPVGTDSVTAVLAADSNYASVTSNVQPETVSKVAGSDVLTTSNATPTFGQSVTLTDAIPVVNGIAPTGTVSFYNGATLLGTGVPNASGIATLATTALPVGTDSVTAVLAADSNYASVTSNLQPETVSKVAGSDVLTTSNATPSDGQSVTLTDTIPVVNGVAPTGLVSFYNGATLLGTGVPNASGVATLATTALPVGTDSVTAVLAADSNYASVTSNVQPETVSKVAGSDVLTTSNATPIFGQSVTLTDIVPVVNGIAPTGKVSFYSGTTLLGTATPNASGVATLATTALPVGADLVTAVLAADSNYASVTSNLQPETVSKATGADVLTTSNATPIFGQSITLTDTIPVVNGVAPTGTVSFYNGATLIGTGTANGAGVATLMTASLPVGTDSVTAVLAADSK